LNELVVTATRSTAVRLRTKGNPTVAMVNAFLYGWACYPVQIK